MKPHKYKEINTRLNNQWITEETKEDVPFLESNDRKYNIQKPMRHNESSSE